MKRITLITGHYGSGKTNFAVNLALRQAAEGKKVTVVDLDIVNPYFRTADFAELFEQNGIHLEKTLYANTSLDIPAISFDLARLAYEEECLIIDVGGDDAGATALGRYAEMLRSYQAELDMWYVVNRYRYLTAQPQEALTLLYEVQQGSPLAADWYCQQFQPRQRNHSGIDFRGCSLCKNHCRSSRSTADLYHLSGRFARTGGKRFSGTSLCQARLGAGCCILNPTDGRFGGRRERAMEKMKVRFDRCKGCGLCVSVCPKKLVKLQTEKRNEKATSLRSAPIRMRVSAVQCVQ